MTQQMHVLLLRISIILSVLIIMACTWWVLGDSDRPASIASVPEQNATPLVAEPSGAKPSSNHAARSQAEATEDLVAPSQEAEFAEAATLHVLIVDAAHQNPVPGASLFVLSEQEHAAPFREVRSRGRSAPEATRRFGIAYRSDEAGTLKIPYADRRCYLLAEQDQSWSFQEWMPGMLQPLKFELKRFEAVAIQVLDGAGQALPDFPVALVTPPGVHYQRSHSHLGFWRGHTNAEGMAYARYEVAHVGGDAKPYRLLAALDAMGVDGEGVSFLAAKPPAEPVILQLPPAGRVVIDLVDADDKPLREPILAGISWSTAEPRLGGPIVFAGTSRLSENGRVVFDPVMLGMDLRVWFQSETGWIEPELEARGPRQADESVQLKAQFTSRRPMLLGRLIDPGGEGFAHLEVQAYFRSTQYWSDVRRVMTDATGAFQLPLYPGVDDSGEHVLELVQWRSLDSNGLPHGPRATIALPREIDTRRHDLGDVVLNPLSLPFAGRVVDAEGQAIPGVAIIVSMKIDHEDGTARWEELPRLASWSDAQGFFQCRGDWPLNACRLHTRAAGYLAQRSEAVTAGALELRFQLSRGGVLDGRVQHDAALLPSDIRISASSQAESLPLTTTVAGDGAFRIAGLSSGRAHVLVRYRGIELAKIEDVAIAASGITRDQRLDPLDLTQLLRSLRLHIVEQSGRQLEDLHLYARKEEHIAWRHSLFLDSTSHVEVHLPVATSTLWVEARGCLPLRFDAAATEVELILKRGPRLRIESNAPLEPVPLGAASTYFVLELDEADADPAWQSYLADQDEIELNRHGQALLDLPRAGRYRLSWPEFEDLVTHFEVLDLKAEQVVKVELPWAARTDSDKDD